MEISLDPLKPIKRPKRSKERLVKRGTEKRSNFKIKKKGRPSKKPKTPREKTQGRKLRENRKGLVPRRKILRRIQP